MSKRLNAKTAKLLRKIAKEYATEKNITTQVEYVENVNKKTSPFKPGPISVKPDSLKFVNKTLKKRFKDGSFDPRADDIVIKQ